MAARAHRVARYRLAVYPHETPGLAHPAPFRNRVQRLESRVQKEAEECFQQALDIARSQNAKSLELRAVMSLSRLWQQQGKKNEAR